MKDPDFPHGETLVTFQPSTMSSLEARAFASSEDPEREIDELSDAAERGSITARIRIGGLLTGLGPKRWREARASWLEALGELGCGCRSSGAVGIDVAGGLGRR